MTATYLPNGEQQFCDANGVPYGLGSVSYYIPSTLTPKPTYQDAAATILNTSPTIALDAAGRCVALGVGDYRQILHDANGVLIWDKVVEAPLPADAIGSAIAPCLQAASLQAFRDCAGITGAIQSAISAVQLLPGPTGPTGPASTVPGATGATGPTGPTGPAGAAGGSGFVQVGSVTIQSVNPGSGFLVGGYFAINFSTAFPSQLLWFQIGNPPILVGTSVGSSSIGFASNAAVNGFCYDGDGNPLPDGTVVSWLAGGV